MGDSDFNTLEFGVIFWVLLFLALWWTVGWYFWRKLSPCAKRWGKKRRRRDPEHGHRRRRRGSDRDLSRDVAQAPDTAATNLTSSSKPD